MVEREHAGADRLVGDDPKLVGLAGWERREIVGVEEPTARARLHKDHGVGLLRLVGPAQRCHLGGGGGQDADEIVAACLDGFGSGAVFGAAPRWELCFERFDLFLMLGEQLVRGP